MPRATSDMPRHHHRHRRRLTVGTPVHRYASTVARWPSQAKRCPRAMQPFLRCCRCTVQLGLRCTPAPTRHTSTTRHAFTTSPHRLVSKPPSPSPDRPPPGPLTDPPQFGKKKPRSPQGGKMCRRSRLAVLRGGWLGWRRIWWERGLGEGGDYLCWS
ncbi:hypothetical protein EV426DRAFT_113759 [Tirmania nivea]|nr:hypothetical protein EV426DRAFT_113759 [Tirmania nivea]